MRLKMGLPSDVSVISPVSEMLTVNGPVNAESMDVSSEPSPPTERLKIRICNVNELWNLAPEKKLNAQPNGRKMFPLDALKLRVPMISNRNMNKNRKPIERPDVPNSKVPPLDTVIFLKLILSSPFKLAVDREQPDGIYKPQPPTEAQKSTVGTTPPIHVLILVKLPDVPAIQVTLSNV